MIMRVGDKIRIGPTEFDPEYLKEKIRMAHVGEKYSLTLSGRCLDWDEYKEFLRDVIRVMVV